MQLNTWGVIASFSPAGDALAIATSDGRVRTFDTGNGRLRCTLGGADSAAAGSQGGVLAESHTCLCWAVGGRQQEKAGKKKGAAGAIGASALAVGTAAGDVKLFDANLGELRWRARNAIEGGVAAVAFGCSPKGQAAIYATGASRQLVALDPSSGEVLSTFDASKHALSCLAIAPDAATAFCGSTGLALWDLASQEQKAKFSGHPTPASSAAYVPGGAHVVSCSPSERHVAIWSAVAPASSKKAKKAQPAAASLSLEDPAVQLDACPQVQGDGQPLQGGFHVAAVSGVGEAYVWACQQQQQDGEDGDGPQGQTRAAEGPGSVRACLLARVRVGGEPSKGAVAGASECILAAKLQPGSQGPVLLVARGSSAKPVFERVHVPVDAPTDGTAPLISLQPCSSGALLPAGAAAPAGAKGDKAKLSHNRNDVTVLGPENLGHAAAMRGPGAAADGPAPVAGVSGRKRAEPEAEAAAADEEDEGDLDMPPEDELPLGQRVAALEERANLSQAEPGPDDEAGPSGQQLPEGSSKADSLAVLLTQALRSNDKALLERCLATSNTRIITNTVRRLVPTDAAQFLRAAVDRVLTRPARAVQLAPWIKALMHYHTGYMMTAPGVRGPLAALYQAIESRVGLYQQMLKVYGRLSLITAHTTQRDAEAGADGAGDDGMPGPEVVFEDEGDEEEPEAEDPFAPGVGEGDEGDEEDEEEGDGLDGDGLGGDGDEPMSEDGDEDASIDEQGDEEDDD